MYSFYSRCFDGIITAKFVTTFVDVCIGSDLAGLSRSNYIDNSVIHHRIDYKPSTDLAELFSKLGLGKYTDLFQQQEVRFCQVH